MKKLAKMKMIQSPMIFLSVISRSRRYIDYRMGAAGAIVMAGIVFLINYYGANDLAGATTAALKQGAYTLLFGGVVMRGCEYLATGIGKRLPALILATLIPSFIAIGLTFYVHSLKGTPKPVESTIPTALFVIPSTAIWGVRKRKQMVLKQMNDHE